MTRASGVFPAGKKRFAQGGFFSSARSEHPDIFCRCDCGVTQRNAVGRRLGRIFDGAENFCGNCPFSFPRKQRRDVAVLAHAEKNQIQNRLAAFVFRREMAKFCFCNFHGGFRRNFAANAMDLIFRNFQRREQKLVCQLEIAFRVGWRDATFIRPEKMDEARRKFFASLACLTVEAKNFCVMRPPESATQCGLAARLAVAISSSHALAARAASSSALAKEISSKFIHSVNDRLNTCNLC